MPPLLGGANTGAVDEITIRPAEADDAEFLADMLVEAANTPHHLDRSRAEALADPTIARYITGWPRSTDLGVVAERCGRSAGAAWLRYFTAERPGCGFVRADVPELVIGVLAAERGRGTGRALLRALAATAGSRGAGQISLSVERAHPAIELYRSEGCRVVEHRDHADTMVLDLREPGGRAVHSG